MRQLVEPNLRGPTSRHSTITGVTGLSCHGAAMGSGVLSNASATRSTWRLRWSPAPTPFRSKLIT